MSAQNLMQEVGKEDPSANTPTRRAMDGTINVHSCCGCLCVCVLVLLDTIASILWGMLLRCRHEVRILEQATHVVDHYQRCYLLDLCLFSAFCHSKQPPCTLLHHISHTTQTSPTSHATHTSRTHHSSYRRQRRGHLRIAPGKSPGPGTVAAQRR